MHKEADAFKVTLFDSLAQTGMGHGTDLVIKKNVEVLPILWTIEKV